MYAVKKKKKEIYLDVIDHELHISKVHSFRNICICIHISIQETITAVKNISIIPETFSLTPRLSLFPLSFLDNC